MRGKLFFEQQYLMILAFMAAFLLGSSHVRADEITEGYYYVVTAGNGTGYYTTETPPDINYNYENRYAIYNNGEKVSWKIFDPYDFDFIYHFSPDGNGNWYMQSALYGTFIDKPQATYSTSVPTSVQGETPQMFAPVGEDKYTIRFLNNSYVYSMNASHNGSKEDEGDLNIWGTTTEAAKYGVNVWYVKRVSDEVMAMFDKTDAALIAKCTKYELATKNLPTDEAPGFHYAENIDNLQKIIDEIKQKAGNSLTDTEKTELNARLDEAYAKALAIRPITDGYYYLVNNYEGYRNAFGDYPALYTTEQACYYDKFDRNNANFIYKITKGEDEDAYLVQNAYTQRYIGSGKATANTGDVLMSSLEANEKQLFRWHSVGKYWMANQQTDNIGHTISNPAALSKRQPVSEATNFDEAVSKELAGYNTWALVPISNAEADNIVAKQRTTDDEIAKTYDSMVAYAKEIAEKVEEMSRNANGKYNTNAVIILNSRYGVVQDYIASRFYDISTTQAEYAEAEAALREAYNQALTAKPDKDSDQPLSGTPIGATSVDYNTGQPSTTSNTPTEAFDGNYATTYASYERSTGWVGLDLGAPHIIERVAYAPRANWNKRMVLGIFEGANKPDFSDAIPIHMIHTAPNYEEMTTEDVNCSKGFRYVRYIGPDDARCNVSELRFYGHPGEGDDSQHLQLTNLPTVVIRTLANVSDVSSKTIWLPGNAYIISDNGTAIKSDSMNVRGRGNGSWTFPKKPYKIKFANKTKLLDMPAKAKKWTLINNYGDKTMVRNNLAFELSRIFQMDYTPACRLVDVIFNGQYKGSYQLCDQIEVNKDRVDITEMTPDDNAGEALTGGYLIELDAYASGEPKYFSSSQYGIPVTVHYPEAEDITDAQFNYIRTAFNDLCSRVFSTKYKSETEGYAAVLAEDTWLKYFLIEELSGNTDGYWSVYMSKDRNGKFRVSPVWDFDLAFDNDQRTHPILTMTGFLSLSSKSSAANGVRSFNRKIVESCSQELKELWSWYRYNGNLNSDRLHTIVDSLGVENDLSQRLNYTRWDILNVRTQQQYTVRGSYKAEVDFLFEYINDRLYWMDNIVGLENPNGIHDATPAEARGGIHGREGHILVRGFAEGSAIRVYTVGGQLVNTTTVQGFDNRIELPKGIYIVRIQAPNGASATNKVAVQ